MMKDTAKDSGTGEASKRVECDSLASVEKAKVIWSKRKEWHFLGVLVYYVV